MVCRCHQQMQKKLFQYVKRNISSKTAASRHMSVQEKSQSVGKSSSITSTGNIEKVRHWCLHVCLFLRDFCTRENYI